VELIASVNCESAFNSNISVANYLSTIVIIITLKNEKISRVKTISRIRASKTPERIVMKFCVMVGFSDVVTRAKLDGDRFGRFCVVGVEFQVIPLTLVVVLTTLWHYRASV